MARIGFIRRTACLLLAILSPGCFWNSEPPLTIKPQPLGHHNVTVATLPAPFASPSVSNPPRVVPQPTGASLNLPPGFEIATYAEGGFEMPRWMALAPNGDVFLSDSAAGTVYVLRDTRGAGIADTRFLFASGLHQPFGLAFHGGYLYVGNTDAVILFRYQPGQIEAEDFPQKMCDLPSNGYNNHWTRNVIFNPDGSKMYVSVGSKTNVSVEPDPMRGTINEYNPDGTGHRFVTQGTRNPVGMAFNPTTGKLWATVQERDGMGDDLTPDYLMEAQDGGFYGWPYAYAGPHEDPRHKGERPDLVARSVVPDVMFESHSAVLGLVFYQGAMLPADYQGDALVAMHGSWNRSKRTGYKVVRVRFKDGRPVGGYDD
ncbi:MAG TPA: PQQ-dependent sugar dehydrogenase, partial [Terriglobia bacterium]|nr:PQQ-dependent sugar dehydrogenase [Terriglobia bacterium]